MVMCAGALYSICIPLYLYNGCVLGICLPQDLAVVIVARSPSLACHFLFASLVLIIQRTQQCSLLLRARLSDQRRSQFAPSPPTRLSARVTAPDTTRAVVIPTRLSMHVATAQTVTKTLTPARAHAAAARLCLAFSPQQTNSNTPFTPSPPTRLSARVAAPDTTRARQGPHRCRRNRL